jgi:hypothetical protein
MVIIREFDSERGFSSIPPLGSATERQIYFHSLRWDGSLDETRYFNKMLNFSDTESDSDTSSDSGSDSDCIIIPRSSFTGKELVVFDPSAATMFTKSKYHSQEMIDALRGAVKFSGSGKECDVIIEPVGREDLVTIFNPKPPHYFLMYGVVVQTFNLWFPFTQFEVSLLQALNIAPIQLHPNSWGFAKAYQLVCLALGIAPSLGVFFSFYHLKSVFPGRLVSLCALPNRTLFALYASNFKGYLDSFYRVRGGPNCLDVMYDHDGSSLFPFYWSSNPRLVKGPEGENLSPFEAETVDFLGSFNILSTKELVKLEANPQGVIDYLSKFCFCYAFRLSSLLDYWTFCLCFSLDSLQEK